ncbi:hypothetical protein [Qipengyuania aquimaris]|uniref:hypothetical protein n=1 Tax=Qipengyuania aquimaris TaxID=255984 RepID=UPI001FD1D96F|nr:hypothetical protein [Qipengyuania aquimaris]UOR14595.1 hypothetical protein LCM05_08825 [Qipengyuania aquimaris]
MFIGHFAPALAARAVTAEAPKLGTLFIAAQLTDWAFFLFALGGIEHLRLVPGITAMNPLDFYDYPITHSLIGTGGFALAMAVAVWFFLRNAVAATWAAIVVMSHWVLDWISHRPDLTIAGGEHKIGLGLWNYPLAAMGVELALVGLAVWWYLRRTKGPIGPVAILVAVMLVFQAINWFGPEPQDVGAPFLLLGMFAFGVLTFLAFWVGKTRWHRNEIGLGVASPPR